MLLHLTYLTRGMLRPHTTVVLAMSADGKIADFQRSPARFGSPTDKTHLETQIAKADGILFGAGTLRAYGTTLRVTDPDLLQQRQRQGKPAQPAQIVCSKSAQFKSDYPFFTQPVPRWLLTTPTGATPWYKSSAFERILTVQLKESRLDWVSAMELLSDAGLRRVVIAGGGDLIASLLAVHAIDELWITVCPLLLGGSNAPSPVEGLGFLADVAPRLELLSSEAIAHEVFLHYRLKRVVHS
jgi:5-amino-6-(5-phosphoribosylamino)uracil reductase